MNKRCKQCREVKDIFMFVRMTDNYGKIKYKTLCKACNSENVKAKRKVKKQEEFVSIYDPEEQAKDAFKDDPRAEKEIDYGKVVRQPTYYPKGNLND